MKASIVLISWLCALSPSLFANDYSEALQFAKEQQAQALQGVSNFDKSSIPNFSETPNEVTLSPSAPGELEEKGRQYTQTNVQAKSTRDAATTFEKTQLDIASQQKAQKVYEQAQKEKPTAPCSDGTCIETHNEVSDDVGTGAVELGALGDMATQVSENQVAANSPGVFGAKNIVCRERWGDVPFDYCTKNGTIFHGTKAEKELHEAQKEGRALRVPGGFFCARERKKWGKRKCVEKKESWCVFQSKLALIVQVQGRRQLGLDFGRVGYRFNRADCKGLTPTQLSQIEFDTPEMSAALNEVVQEYTSRRRLPSKSNSTSKVDDYVKTHRQGEGNE